MESFSFFFSDHPSVRIKWSGMKGMLPIKYKMNGNPFWASKSGRKYKGGRPMKTSINRNNCLFEYSILFWDKSQIQRVILFESFVFKIHITYCGKKSNFSCNWYRDTVNQCCQYLQKIVERHFNITDIIHQYLPYYTVTCKTSREIMKCASKIKVMNLPEPLK